MLDKIFDYDDQFFRMVSVALARTMNKSIRWINYFTPLNENETGRKRVCIPFYTSLTGDERFSLDAFVDDVVDTRVTVNTDQFQRGQITFNNFGSRSDQFANPNQYLSQKANINGTLRKVISKVKAVPISINYDIEIQLATQNEVDKCSQKLMNMLYNYMFFNIDYFGIKIDAILLLPDDKNIEIQREISMESDRKKFIKFSLEIQTYYPIFKIDIDDLIVCDNDDDIDWEYLGIAQPTEDFVQSVKNYNESFGILNIKGGVSGSTTIEGLSPIQRSYWETYYHELGREKTLKEEREEFVNPPDWQRETFDHTPGPGDSAPPDPNDID
jgi:hypothetical protein